MIRIALLGLFLCLPAQAQQCQTRAVAVKHLADKYQEQPVLVGVDRRGVVEVLKTQNGSTWTIIITLPNGCAEFVAAGDNWQRLKPVYRGRES